MSDWTLTVTGYDLFLADCPARSTLEAIAVMRIGILGAGVMADALGTRWALSAPRKVQATERPTVVGRKQREVVQAFLTAARCGDTHRHGSGPAGFGKNEWDVTVRACPIA